jgi:FKBP-type peptidyl-prolyl cis-trans isomerase SlyD
MPIPSRRVVTIRFTLADEAGNPLAVPEAGRPLTYLEGGGKIAPGLERALHGKLAGQHLTVTVAAADGYGPRDETRVRTLPRGRLPDRVAVGTRCRVQTDEGYLPALITALDAAAELATVDLNHPLAGLNLRFEVAVLEARDATPDELAHGHAHGPGGAH